MAERTMYEVTVEVSREQLGDGRERIVTRTYQIDADKLTEERIKPYTPPGIYAWHTPAGYTTHLLHFWRNNAVVWTVDASAVESVYEIKQRSS